MHDTQVHSEADREELMGLIYDNTPGFVQRDVVDAVIREEEHALALLLQKAERLEDGSLRAEIYGGDIIHLKRIEAHTQTVFGQTVQIPTHYAVYVKKHAVALDILENALGLPCRNG
jgi:hypothetical protein